MVHTSLKGLALAWAAALPTAMGAVLSQRAAVPKGWSLAKTDASSDVHTFTIALAMQNIDQLESKLLAVSTPGSDGYGKYYNLADITAMFGPSSDTVSAVTSWLESSGISSYNVEGAFIDFASDVASANSLFNASYQYFTKNGVTKLRTLSYAVPESVESHITLVDPGNYFGNIRSFVPTRASEQEVKHVARQASSTTVDASCQTSITPRCVKQMYNIGCYTPLADSGSKIGFGSFLNESAVLSDLFTWEKLYNITQQGFDVEIIAGGINDQNATTASAGEADLDVENIVGVAHPLPVVEYSTGGSPPFVPNIDQPTPADNQNEPYVPYYRYLLNKTNDELPQVITNSYGDEEDSVPYDYANLTCTLIGMMGLRGITVLESSGDLGVGAGCLAPDGVTVEFNAIFPATCPYVTSVGGTVAVTPEVGWDGSSGGFSNYFSRPAYQDAAVAEYLHTQVSAETMAYYGQYTNFSGRGFPDVAAHSTSPSYHLVVNGRQGGEGGTSAASPVWAGVIGLLNDARLRAGKPALGFLNPLIYAFGAGVLNDITAGFSVGCNGKNTQTGGSEPAGAGVVEGARWNATIGWDPVTGMGTPNFGELLKLVVAL